MASEITDNSAIFFHSLFKLNNEETIKLRPFNSSPSTVPHIYYMRRWTRSALVQVKACRLFGAKPLPEPMLPNCQLDYKEQTAVKFES